VRAQDQALSHFEERPAPIHVAIIIDGNDGWASQRGLPRIEAHRRSLERTRDCIRAAADLGISYLTLFGFFSEQWTRPRIEAAHHMKLLSRVIRRDLAELHEKNVKLRIIGSGNGLPRNLAASLREAVSKTEGNTGLQLVIAFNYGARDEIVRAAQHNTSPKASNRENFRPKPLRRKYLRNIWTRRESLIRISSSGLVANSELATFCSGNVLIPSFYFLTAFGQTSHGTR
jgi:undecaprenyl diphosphate synthase